jgi:hypothetical protein
VRDGQRSGGAFNQKTGNGLGSGNTEAGRALFVGRAAAAAANFKLDKRVYCRSHVPPQLLSLGSMLRLSQVMMLVCMFASLCLSQVGADSLGSGEWTLVFLTEAAKKGAVCIDGSPGCVINIVTRHHHNSHANSQSWQCLLHPYGQF